MNTVFAIFFGGPGTTELIIVGVIALLLFGKRLPEVARSLGKGIVEFKRGVQGIEEEVNDATYASSKPAARPVDDDEEEDEGVTAPKFEPPKTPPSDAQQQD
jgi:sec-independent protein translocase protein TatA